MATGCDRSILAPAESAGPRITCGVLKKAVARTSSFNFFARDFRTQTLSWQSVSQWAPSEYFRKEISAEWLLPIGLYPAL